MAIYRFNNYQPKIAASAWVHELAYVAGEVVLGDNVSIWPHASLRGDVGLISIGSNSNVQDNAVIHCTHASDSYAPKGYPTTIGENVIIGHGAVVHGSTIADEVLVGMNSTILDGVIIESQVIVAAGALVPPRKKLLTGRLYAGNPAKEIRLLTDSEKAFFKYSASHYVGLAKQHQQSMKL